LILGRYFPELMLFETFQLRDFTDEGYINRNTAILCALLDIVSTTFCALELLSWTSPSYRTCAIVGGVLTVAGLIDSFIFSSRKKLTGSNPVEGFGGRQGKMVSLGISKDRRIEDE
jgi:hypothetical protein